MIIALAGRRIDAPDNKQPRFPLTNIDRVSGEVEQYFTENRVAHLVCAAACGGDLTALRVAEKLGVDFSIVLPFPSKKFKANSVSDCIGEWNNLYEVVIKKAKSTKRLYILNLMEEGSYIYETTNVEILNVAKEAHLKSQFSIDKSAIRSLILWDGWAKSEDDLTLHFAQQSKSKGIPVDEIITL